MPAGDEERDGQGRGGLVASERALSPEGRAGPMLEASTERSPSDRLLPGWEAKYDSKRGKYFYVNHRLRVMR